MELEHGLFMLPTPKKEKQIYRTGFIKTFKGHREIKTISDFVEDA
jgi:hypothetical protein